MYKQTVTDKCCADTYRYSGGIWHLTAVEFTFFVTQPGVHFFPRLHSHSD